MSVPPPDPLRETQVVPFTVTPEDNERMATQLHAQAVGGGMVGGLLKGLFFVGSMCGIYGVMGLGMQLPLPPRHGAYLSNLRDFGLAAGAGFLLLFVWAYARHEVIKREVRKAATHASKGPMQVRVELGPVGLKVARPGATSLYDWPFITTVEVVGDSLAIGDVTGPIVFVPRSAFADAASFESFFQTAKAFQATGQGG